MIGSEKSIEKGSAEVLLVPCVQYLGSKGGCSFTWGSMYVIVLPALVLWY